MISRDGLVVRLVRWSGLGKLVWSARRRFRRHIQTCQIRSLRRMPCDGADRPVSVAYLHHGFPASPSRSAIGGGGGVKYIWLDRRFPHGFPACDVLYAVSSARHSSAEIAFAEARRKGIPILWNQNGAYFPHAYPAEVAARGNREMARLLHEADYVLYQSEFAQASSDNFLGRRDGPCEVLYNAVDTSFFVPARERCGAAPVVLAAGSHDCAYRLPLAIETYLLARQRIDGLRLVVAGRLSQRQMPELLRRLDQAGAARDVEWVGPYAPSQAPAVFSRADLFLHVTYSDVCPSVTLEAMSCGLPIVFSATGGTPELVGDAGIGIPGEMDWRIARPPPAELLSEAIVAVCSDLPRLSERARRRAVDRFDIQPWLARHEAVFRKLIGRSGA